MISMILSPSERLQVEETFKTTRARRLRDRCQALLMAERARPPHPMATDLGITTRTLQRWRNAYRVRGLAGLAMQWATGRPPSLPATLAPTILAWVQQGPAGCGLDRATWTYAELATSLYQTQGLAVSETTMRMFCPKHGVRPYRPTYPDLKGDPEKQAGAPQEFDALKNS